MNELGHNSNLLHRWMPTGENEIAELRQRAAQLAAQNVLHEKIAGESFLNFYLGSKEQYGIPYEYLDGILPCKALCKVPCTKDFIAGIIDRRGELLTVLDPKRFFQIENGEASLEKNVIVLRQKKRLMGLLVNEITGHEEYHVEQLTSPLEIAGVSHIEYVKGIWQGKTAILDVPFLFKETLQESAAPA